MVQMTLQVSDELAERCQLAGSWLPTIIELGFMGFKTPAAATAADIIGFLSGNPSPQEVFGYHVTETSQSRLRRLLAFNQARYLGEAEQLELDELQRLEHIIIMLKARVI